MRSFSFAFAFLLFSFSLKSNAATNLCAFNCPKDAHSAIANKASQLGSTSSLTCAPTSVKKGNAPDFLKEEESPLAQGARKTMALMYGSCEVLKFPVRSLIPYMPKDAEEWPDQIPGMIPKVGKNKRQLILSHNGSLRVISTGSKEEMIRNHPYLFPLLRPGCDDKKMCDWVAKNPRSMKKGVFADPNSCESHACFVLNHPPLYQYGEKPTQNSLFDTAHLSPNKKTWIKGPKGAGGIDCSGYVSQSLAMVGARFTPNETPGSRSLGTSELAGLGAESRGEAKDCFDRVVPKEVMPGAPKIDLGVKSGDILVVSKNHAVVIDTVGSDPFGIQNHILKKMGTGKKDELSQFDQIIQNRVQEKMALKGKKDGETKKNLEAYHDMSLGEVLRSKKTSVIKVKFLDLAAEAICDELMLPASDYKVTIAHSSPRGGQIGIQRERLFPGVGPMRSLSEQKAIEKKRVMGQSSMGTSIAFIAKVDCLESVRQRWLTFTSGRNSELADDLVDPLPFSKKWADTENAPGSGAGRLIRYAPHRLGCEPDPSLAAPVEGKTCLDCCNTTSSYDELVTKPKALVDRVNKTSEQDFSEEIEIETDEQE